MKEEYIKPKLEIILFHAARPIAEDTLDENALSHDNGYVEYWSLDQDVPEEE